jgi:hypothetical protein
MYVLVTVAGAARSITMFKLQRLCAQRDFGYGTDAKDLEKMLRGYKPIRSTLD